MYTNKLIHEKSPYLLQHAHNPVDWNPWGEEAFAKARREDKPIFLSIGYSTCHWCHVMERESFESPEVAAVLNRHFVPIKVDREERPDVDHVYMTYVQAATGGGGWPMSVWLTPEGRPFYGGTYFPPADMYGRPGFVTVLEKLAEAWSLQRERIVQSSENVLEQIRAQAEPEPGDAGRLDAAVSDGAFQLFRRVFDPRHGGFGNAPKFPRPVTLNFLLRYWARTRNREALDMVLLTLRRMAGGGMNDHLGGGFHRYSVDERWFVPHFEKMLYDQAQLAVSYLEACQVTGEAFFADVARRTLDYVLRQMTHPDGPFYSAEDADSVIDAAQPEHKGEGAFYVWSAKEIGEVLGEPDAGWFCRCYGVEPGGNVRQDPHGEFAGRNILFESCPAGEAAAGFGVPEERLKESLAAARRKLFEVRQRRVRPHLDDKVLVSWNALMISAFARGAQVLGERRYEEAAVRAAEFVLGRMYDARTGDLMRRYRDGETAIPAFLDDYAFLGLALADLYETVFEPRYLETAIRLAEALLARFEDPVKGGFFAAGEGDPSLVIRLKDDYDGAEPSGNSMAVLALLRLGHATGRADFLRSADRALGALAGRLTSMPEAMPQLLVALEFLLAAPKQIVLTGDRRDPVAQAMCREVWARFLPGRILLFAGAPGRESIVRLAPALGEMAPAGGRPAAYVCENFACRLPVTGVEALAELLK